MNSKEQLANDVDLGSLERTYVGVTIDVASSDLEFTYSVPAALESCVELGTAVLVRVGHSVRHGWVTTMNPAVDIDKNKILDLIGLDDYHIGKNQYMVSTLAAHRYGTSKIHFFKHHRSASYATPKSLSEPKFDSRSTVFGASSMRVSPCDDVVKLVGATVANLAENNLRSLVLVPTDIEAKRFAKSMSTLGVQCLYLDRRQTKTRRNLAVDTDCVVMTRIGVFAPIATLGAIFVVDPQDKGHQNQGEPTWRTSVVARIRAEIEHCQVILVSGYPSPDTTIDMKLLRPSTELHCWPTTKIVDLGDHFGSLMNQELTGWVSSVIESVRLGPKAPLGLLLNRKGKVNRFACAKCKTNVRCEICGSLMAMGAPYLEPGRTKTIEYLHHYEFRTKRARDAFEQIFPKGLTCPSCHNSTPVSCPNCKSTSLKAVGVGTSRLADELSLALGRKVDTLDSSTKQEKEFFADIVVGTESLLLRYEKLAGIALVDVDQMAFSSSFNSLNIIFRTWYKSAVAIRRFYGSIDYANLSYPLFLVQTREPNSVLAGAIANRAPDQLLTLDRKTRREMDLPPFSALAELKGSNVDQVLKLLDLPDLFIDTVEAGSFDVVPTGKDRLVIKAKNHQTLSTLLSYVGASVHGIKVHMDPTEI